jgi:cytochrome b6-f complex iron-sulfur subunit
MRRRSFLTKLFHRLFYFVGAFALGFPVLSFITFRKPNEKKVVFHPDEQFSGLHFKDGVFLEKRDESLHALSSRCTHLGCTLGYDVLSNQFRCPCHGSVFDRSGKRISGPAEKNLSVLPFERLSNGDIVVVERL